MKALRLSLVAACAALLGAIAGVSPALAGGSGWHLGSYNSSGQALSFGSTGTGAGLASLNFTNQPNTALLVTDQGSSQLTGDLTGMTVSTTFEISGMSGSSAFNYGGSFCGNSKSAVRLFFETSNAGGFDETHFWWSNPVFYTLSGNSGQQTLTASLNDPSQWSDFFGHFGTEFPADYANAVANVTMIGLSFGGGCFFENGVGTSDGTGTFTLDSFNVQ